MEQNKNWYFIHERLDVYRVALEFLTWYRSIEPRLRGRGKLREQLERAGTSVVLNIAEGASQRTAANRKRYYRVAKGSAAECSSALDAAAALGVEIQEGQDLIHRVGAMLGKMAY